MRLIAAVFVVVALTACSSHDSTSPTTAKRTTTSRAATTTSSSTPATTETSVPSTAGPRGNIPAYITRDCSKDVTQQLQAWFNHKPDGSVIEFQAHSCYRIDSTLFVRDRHHVRIEGNGAVLKAITLGDRTRMQLVLQGGSDIRVHNLVVRGANYNAGSQRGAYHPDFEAQHAFVVSGATDVVFDDVQAYDLYGDFVYIGSGTRGETSRNVTVSNSEFSRSGRQGISITNAVNVTIKNNKIGEVARSLFDIEPNDATQQARSIHIIGNTTGAAGNFWIANKGAPASIGDIEVSGNHMTDPTGGLIFVFVEIGPYRGPFLFENNTLIANNKVSDEKSKGAFFFTHAENITIRDNTVSFEGGDMPVVELRDSHHVQVTGNRFYSGGETIVATDGSSDYHAS
jgi:hypothetical protein